MLRKPQYMPKGHVFVIKLKNGRYFKSVNPTQTGIITTDKVNNAWHTHSIFGANQMLDQFRSGGVDVELAAIPAFCGYCSGF